MKLWKLESCFTRPAAKTAKCCICGQGFPLDTTRGWKNVPVMVKEEQNSNFRGDDTVTFAHPNCLKELQK